MAKLGENNISTSLVATTIGETTNDVGALCQSNNINKWSKWKPVRKAQVTPMTAEDMKSVAYGLYGDRYDKPQGGASSPFRLGDFRNYNHDAYPPISPMIISVDGQTTPPYNIFRGDRIQIVFKLIAGDIDPKDLDPQTVREKNKETDGGYGGLSWIAETRDSSPTTVVRFPNEVFGTEIPNVEFTQFVTVEYMPRLQYMYYQGAYENKYISTAKKARDSSYQALFSLVSYADFISMVPMALFYDSISDKVIARVNITNTRDAIAEVRLRARFTISGGSTEYRVEGSLATLAGETMTTRTLQLNYLVQGADNTYNSVYFFLEKKVGEGWISLREERIIGETIYIPMPD